MLNCQQAEEANSGKPLGNLPAFPARGEGVSGLAGPCATGILPASPKPTLSSIGIVITDVLR